MFNWYLLQLSVLSALVYAIADAWGLLLTHYLLFGFWVAYSPTVGESLKQSIARLGGIAGGGLIGMIFMVCWDESSLVVAIGLFTTVLFYYAIGKPQYLSQAMVSFCMVSIGHYGDGLDRYYWERFSYNSCGVLIGVMASRLLPPPPATIQLWQGMGTTLTAIAAWYRQLLTDYGATTQLDKTVRQVKRLLTNNGKLLDSAQGELSQGMGNTAALERQQSCHRMIQALMLDVQDLEGSIVHSSDTPLVQILWPEISDLMQTTYQVCGELGQISGSTQIEGDTLKNALANLSASLTNLDHRLTTLRGTGATFQQDLASVVQVSVFLDDLKEIAHKLILLHENMVQT